ncbi:hypothetical protein E4665_17205 [Sporolactobacillus shoreae]|uniref:Uncharacterized protein n=2 Tax=Sporolactobacillus shoreae TaxID=1465501 RepID=A0A4Z0GGX6_9BACL|nr:hypothetical protein E4665_17205 [Sporolactobacillus shoreae]
MDFIEGYMTGNAWEELCVQCYRNRYREVHYTAIPAVQGGDGGIEGFTVNGIVNQCYCPEREYTDKELYEHLREKVSTDIKKLLSPEYAKRLRNWGVPPIKEWHFVIPEYKDARILAHVESKRKEVLEKKKKDPTAYAYIDTNFKILVKCAEEFAPEISRIIRTNLTDMKLNLAVIHTGTPDWSKCDSVKVDNIRRKIKAVMHVEGDADEDLNLIINMYIEFYISGLEIMNTLRIDFPEFYEDLFKLEESYKNEVKIKTRMHTNRAMNQALFDEILNEFQAKLERDFSKVFTLASIGELKQDLIASWLADCSMEFRSV